MLKSEADRLTRVIVCTPEKEYYDAETLAEHNILERPDRGNALAQHLRLKELLSAFGADVVDAPELAGHPNSVFTRDAAVCTPRGYIELRPGIDTRQAEGRWMAGILDGLQEPCAGKIVAPGSVDGGDVVLWGELAFIGLSQRTNKEGCRQLSALLRDMGYAVVSVSLPETILHLDKVLMPVSEKQLLVCGNIVPESALSGIDTISIDFDLFSTANIICLGDGACIVGDTNRAAIERLKEASLTVHPMAISEFVKGAGGPNCLIMPVSRGTGVSR